MNTFEVNRFARLEFGRIQSPFVLEGTLTDHFNNYKFVYPKFIENIRDDMYVHDLVSGVNILGEIEIN